MALSRPQKIYSGILLGAAALWLLLKLGLPIYEYAHGKDALTALLEQISAVLGFTVIGIGVLYTILQRIGVLPTVTPPGTPPANNGMRRLRSLVVWIVIALLLVLFFNLLQSGKVPFLDRGMANLALQCTPFALIVVVWIFLILRMNAKKKKDLGGGQT